MTKQIAVAKAKRTGRGRKYHIVSQEDLITLTENRIDLVSRKLAANKELCKSKRNIKYCIALDAATTYEGFIEAYVSKEEVDKQWRVAPIISMGCIL